MLTALRRAGDLLEAHALAGRGKAQRGIEAEQHAGLVNKLASRVYVLERDACRG